MKFYICENCGKIVEVVSETETVELCCGNDMKELIPGTSDGAFEKHVPVVTKQDNQILVQVGSVEHPMIEAHYIEWIVIETKKGSQKVSLSHTDEPKAEFVLADGDEFVAAYAYCNLHGLWKSE